MKRGRLQPGRWRCSPALWGTLLGTLLGALPGAPAVAAPAAPTGGERELGWAEAFPVDAAPAGVHFKARYQGSDGAQHTLESWRAGTSLLHRRTDDTLDLYVQSDDAAAGHYHYRLVDHRRHAVIDVGRTNLFRIGVFTDWLGLAHAVSAPRGSARVSRGPADTAVDHQACEWRRVEAGSATPGTGPASEICWSASWGLPLRIRPAASVSSVAEAPATAGPASPDSFSIVLLERLEPDTLAVPPDVPAGYDYIDADADIDPSSD